MDRKDLGESERDAAVREHHRLEAEARADGRHGDYQPGESTRASYERDTLEGRIQQLSGLLRDEKTAHFRTRMALEAMNGNFFGGICVCGNRFWNHETGKCSNCGSIQTSADKLSIAEHRATNDETEEE